MDRVTVRNGLTGQLVVFPCRCRVENEPCEVPWRHAAVNLPPNRKLQAGGTAAVSQAVELSRDVEAEHVRLTGSLAVAVNGLVRFFHQDESARSLPELVRAVICANLLILLASLRCAYETLGYAHAGSLVYARGCESATSGC